MPRTLLLIGLSLSCLYVLAFASAAPSQEDADTAVFEKAPRLTFVGEWTDPSTQIRKRYYMNEIKMTWAQSKVFCEDLAMEPVAIESADEMAYLKTIKNESIYFWTAGIQKVEYQWDIRGGLPIYNTDTANWCGPPADPICIAFHITLHSVDCDRAEYPFCQS